MARNKIKAKLLVVAVLLISDLGLIYNIDFDALLFGNIHLNYQFSKYQTFQTIQTNKISRKWLDYAIDLGKQESIAPPAAARLYAYVSTVFSEVIEKTNSPTQASLATAAILNVLVPDQKNEIDKFLTSLSLKNESLNSISLEILDKYKTRNETDNYYVPEDKTVPRGSLWYARHNKIDMGDQSGKWLTWAVSKEEPTEILKPPTEGSLADILELKKINYITRIVRPEDYDASVFWNGGVTGYDANNVAGASWTGRNAPLAGIWQDILFVEEDRRTSEIEYSKAQKILAQTIADSLIKTWQVKYEYWTERPSARIKSLSQLVQDPPLPSYVSEHSTASYAAAVVLSSLFPEKKDAWFYNAEQAKNSRILAGVQFDIDNRAGEYLGRRIGEKIINNLALSSDKYMLKTNDEFLYSNPVKNIFELALLDGADLLKNAKQRLNKSISDWLAHKPNSKFIIANTEAGILNPALPRGNNISWVDYNNDGQLDLLVTNRLLKNDGHGVFTNVTELSGLADGYEIGGVIFGDYDNDGCPDAYLIRSGPNINLEDVGLSDQLYHNNCNGTFTDVTKKSGIKDSLHGFGAAWADYDNDGLLDIYVANIGLEIPDVTLKARNAYVSSRRYPNRFGVAYRSEPNILYHNNGGGTFTDVTKKAKVMGVAKCGGIMRMGTGLDGEALGKKTSYQPVWLDYNNDNRPDLFVATDGGISPLYRNNGNGTFTDVTEEAGLCRSGSGMGVAIGDYDNDGNLDIYVTNTGENYLWHNNGNGTFSEVAEKAGVADKGNGWGTDFFDYDNDGDLDLVVANGNNPEDYKNDPAVDTSSKDSFYENLGNGKFANVTKNVGLSGDEYKKGVAHGDYNNDGFEDMYVNVVRGLGENHGYLYRNVGNGNHWLKIQLIGTKSNRDGVSARITLKLKGRSQIKEIIEGSSHVSQNSLLQTFGLGKTKMAYEIEVRWPSGLTQILNNVKADQKIVVTEGVGL